MGNIFTRQRHTVPIAVDKDPALLPTDRETRKESKAPQKSHVRPRHKDAAIVKTKVTKNQKRETRAKGRRRSVKKLC